MLVRQLSLYSMSVLYIVAGANHFWHKAMYLAIMPAWLGYHEALVLLSGAFEIIAGLATTAITHKTLSRMGYYFVVIGGVSGQYTNDAKLPIHAASIHMAYHS